jgi:hypothetical protein
MAASVLLAVIGVLLLAAFGPFGGVPLLLLGVGMALAGRGNRIAWLLIASVVIGLTLWAQLLLRPYYFDLLDNVVGGVLLFALLPLHPALLLWLAHAMRRRSERKTPPAGSDQA